ncbi:MAG: GGDEF domain-containing protein [Actinomycetota bacterium]
MSVEKAQDVLKLLERAEVEHLAWLTRIHCALMFREGQSVMPPAPVDPCAAAGPCRDQLMPLSRARAAMLAAAEGLLAGGGGVADQGRYRAFMQAVDAHTREVHRAQALLRRTLVETDPLTGVHNRQGMMRDLRREWTRALRSGRPCCVAVADLDHFKQVNDTWGHAAGDTVLCHTARFFKRQLRPYDLVYRYGGEEFLFCLPDTDAATASHALDRLRALLARSPVRLSCGTEVTATCSIGVAEMDAEHSVQESVMAADRALYRAKEAGRNRVEVAPLPARIHQSDLVLAASNAFRGAVRH